MGWLVDQELERKTLDDVVQNDLVVRHVCGPMKWSKYPISDVKVANKEEAINN